MARLAHARVRTPGVSHVRWAERVSARDRSNAAAWVRKLNHYEHEHAHANELLCMGGRGQTVGYDGRESRGVRWSGESAKWRLCADAVGASGVP